MQTRLHFKNYNIWRKLHAKRIWNSAVNKILKSQNMFVIILKINKIWNYCVNESGLHSFANVISECKRTMKKYMG